jgi:hypothetical protein
MWHKSLLTLALIGASFLGTYLHGGASQDAKPKAPTHRLQWLEGNWIGKGLGGEAQEVWLAPKGGAMLGTFRLTVAGKPSFYELMTITEKEGQLTMGLKHFHPNLVGWEEKKESKQWPESEATEQRIRFGPVLYELQSENELHIWVELGEDQVEKLVLHRGKL